MKYYKIGSRDAEGDWCPRKFYLGSECIDSQLVLKNSVRYARDGALVMESELGQRLDFTLASFSIPVVSKRLGEALCSVVSSDEMQLIPVTVQGETRHGDFFVLNSLRQVSGVVDEANSEFMRWEVSDGRPDKLGKYRMVMNLKVDESKCRDLQIFRIEEWSVWLIVSEEVHKLFEKYRFTGADFKPCF